MPSEREIRNRRRTAVVLVVGAAIAILAAADVGPFADETEEDRVRDVVERFIAARDEGDLVTVCGMLTPTLKRGVQATSGARPGTRPPTCAEVLDAREEAGPDRDRASELEIVDVSVSGNRARASVERTEGISRSLTLELIGVVADLDVRELTPAYARRPPIASRRSPIRSRRRASHSQNPTKSANGSR